MGLVSVRLTSCCNHHMGIIISVAHVINLARMLLIPATTLTELTQTCEDTVVVPNSQRDKDCSIHAS